MAESLTRVAPRLYVGGAEDLTGDLRTIDMIILAAREWQPRLRDYQGVVIRCGFDDSALRGLTVAEQRLASQGAAHVVNALTRGQSVLCTCYQGLNRSALVAALALQQLEPALALPAMLGRIRRARGPLALSNPGFVAYLRQSETARAAAAPPSATELYRSPRTNL